MTETHLVDYYFLKIKKNPIALPEGYVHLKDLSYCAEWQNLFYTYANNEKIEFNR